MFNLMAHGEEIHRGVVVFDNWLESPEDIINIGKQDDRWTDAEVIDDDGNQDVQNEVRLTRKLGLSPQVDYDSTWYFIAKALKQMGYRYANMYKAYFGSMEFPQMLYYPADIGYYADHVDAAVGNERVFSAVLYLNTVDNGGETRFVDLDLSVKPVAGRLVMFPANYLFRHEATKPIGQDKFSIVTWYRMDSG